MRRPNPGDYEAALEAVRELVAEVERQAGAAGATVGVGVPGSVSPKTGRMRNANSVWLNDQPFQADLERALGRPVRLENDANCFALSEALGGAAQGAEVVFGAILGTGCGGGVVVRGRTVEGVNRHRRRVGPHAAALAERRRARRARLLVRPRRTAWRPGSPARPSAATTRRRPARR